MTLKSIEKIKKAKKILILGFGKEGRSSFLFLKKNFPQKIIGVADKKKLNEFPKKTQKLLSEKKINLHLGENYLSFLKKYDLVFKSPGVPLFEEIKKEKQKIITQTEIFLEKHRQKTIGITGTKGKSTTATLLNHILKTAGKKTFLLGNIGKPSLDFFEKKADFFVMELSSHQLYFLKTSPHIAIFLNFKREHLDYYKNLKEYFSAKIKIAKYQKKEDFFIFNENDIPQKLISKIKSKKIPFSFKKKSILKEIKKENPLLGEHNLLNLIAVFLCAKILKIKKETIKKALKNFSPLEHRLEFVGEFQKIKFFNDSASTIPESTIYAIKALKNVGTLILGGTERKQSYKELIKEILQKKIENVILFPETGIRLSKEFFKMKLKKPRVFLCFSMKDAVKLSFKITPKGKICLLSPGAPSFSLFKNFEERGKLFKKYVLLFGKREI